MTIVEAMDDPALFGPWFRDPSWRAWRVFLTAVFGLPISEADAPLYSQGTGRREAPTAQAREAWVVVGRRGGKSRIAALVAVYLACFREYRAVLAPGEVATLPIVAADRRQARTILHYANGFFDGVPMLGQMVTNRTRDSIELSNGVVVEVHTASWRTLRGYTMVAAVADELAFWRDETSANPDTDILAALRPGMASVPGALLLAISSPYARRGALWDAYRRHYAQDGDPVVVWQGPTRMMNPNVDPQVIADAYADDEAAAAAEYGGAFRTDLEAFIGREIVDACVIPDRFELPPTSGVRYRAFVDPSGGSQDSMTLAISHQERGGRWIVDAVRERRPPFSPADVVAEFSRLLKTYHLVRVTGDRYAGAWPVERFAEHGVKYEPCTMVKTDIYRDLLPILNSSNVELLDNKRLIAQLVGLERRTARGGRDSIDHGPGGHDDLVNAVAGSLVGIKKWVPLYAS